MAEPYVFHAVEGDDLAIPEGRNAAMHYPFLCQ